MAQQMVINAAATTIGLSLATLSYATRLVAGEAYQAKLDGLFGVRYEVRALHTSEHSLQCHADTSHGAVGTGTDRLAQPLPQSRQGSSFR